MTPEDVLVITINTITNIIGITFNLLLICAIIANRVKYVRLYSYVLLNFALTDLGGCFAALFTQIRLVPIGYSAIYLSSGICGVFGGTGCIIGYSILIHFYAHCLWSLLISFLFRYAALFHDKWLSKCRVLGIIFFFYSFSFIQCIQLPFANSDQEVLTQTFLNKFPGYNMTYHTISGHINVLSWGVLPAMLHMTVPVTPVYIIIICLRRSIVNGLKNVAISESAKRMHSQLLQAITLQAVLPAIYVIPVLFFVLRQTGIVDSSVLEYMILPVFGLIPIASPLITLHYVKPYNRWTKRFMTCKRGEIDTTGSSKEHAASHRDPKEGTSSRRF